MKIKNGLRLWLFCPVPSRVKYMSTVGLVKWCDKLCQHVSSSSFWLASKRLSSLIRPGKGHARPASKIKRLLDVFSPSWLDISSKCTTCKVFFFIWEVSLSQKLFLLSNLFCSFAPHPMRLFTIVICSKILQTIRNTGNTKNRIINVVKTISHNLCEEIFFF